MSSHLYTCNECGYQYHTITGKQQDECPECGARDWHKKLTHP